jgi:hypothetical protein
MTTGSCAVDLAGSGDVTARVGGKMDRPRAPCRRPRQAAVSGLRVSVKKPAQKQSWMLSQADLLDRAHREIAQAAECASAGRCLDWPEHLTWAMTAHVPAMVAEVFARIVAADRLRLSLCECPDGGATATRHAASGIWRITRPRAKRFQHFSRKHETPGRIIRFTTIDMRYGVLHDVATRVKNGVAINLEAGHVNVIWQGDANAMVLRSFGHCTTPTMPLNVSGPETVSVRWLAEFRATPGRAAGLHRRQAADGWPSAPPRRCAVRLSDRAQRGSSTDRGWSGRMPTLGRTLITMRAMAISELQVAVKTSLSPSGWTTSPRCRQARWVSLPPIGACSSRWAAFMPPTPLTAASSRRRRHCPSAAASPGSAWCWSRANTAAAAWPRN